MPEFVVALGSYLASLEEREAGKPEGERRHVPNLTELAKSVEGVERTGLSRIVHNRVNCVNRKVIAQVIASLHRRGFPCDVGDLLRYVE